MFQFPGFASPAYVFSWRYPKGVGCPIRISTDQSLLAAPHGFSQRATSFIASWCQGIHRMPLSRSIRASHSQTNDCLSTIHRNHRRTGRRQPPTTHPRTLCTTAPSSLYSALTHTPLTTIATPGWTTLGTHAPRSLPVRHITRRHDGPTLPQSKPAPKRQPNHNRAVLRAQRRTRTRFTVTKEQPPTSLAQWQALQATRHDQPPHALGGTPDKPIEEPSHEKHQRPDVRRQTSGMETIGFEPMTLCLQSRCSTN